MLVVINKKRGIYLSLGYDSFAYLDLFIHGRSLVDIQVDLNHVKEVWHIFWYGKL
jgi:hypothetical protein